MGSPKYVLIVVFAIAYLWVLVSTIPMRKEISEKANLNDYFKRIEREKYVIGQAYKAMLADPETDPEALTDKEEELALILWEDKKPGEAILLIQKVVDKRNGKLNNDVYGTKWEKSMLNMAGIYRDISNWNAAKLTYKTILAYNTAMAEKDPNLKSKIARDHNNIGLILYMEACGEESEESRTKLMKESLVELDKAVQLWQKEKGPDSMSEGNTLWNMYLVKRDLGMKKEANEVKARAIKIDEKMNRKAKAPI